MKGRFQKLRGLSTDLDRVQDNIGRVLDEFAVEYGANNETFVNLVSSAFASSRFIAVDATAASLSVTLPQPGKGVVFSVMKKDSSANTVTVIPPANRTINGQATYVFAAQYDSATFVGDGSNWLVFA